MPVIKIRWLPITIIAGSVVVVTVVGMQNVSYVTLQPDHGVDQILIAVEA